MKNKNPIDQWYWDSDAVARRESKFTEEVSWQDEERYEFRALKKKLTFKDLSWRKAEISFFEKRDCFELKIWKPINYQYGKRLTCNQGHSHFETLIEDHLFEIIDIPKPYAKQIAEWLLERVNE